MAQTTNKSSDIQEEQLTKAGEGAGSKQKPIKPKKPSKNPSQLQLFELPEETTKVASDIAEKAINKALGGLGVGETYNPEDLDEQNEAGRKQSIENLKELTKEKAQQKAPEPDTTEIPAPVAQQTAELAALNPQVIETDDLFDGVDLSYDPTNDEYYDSNDLYYDGEEAVEAPAQEAEQIQQTEQVPYTDNDVPTGYNPQSNIMPTVVPADPAWEQYKQRNNYDDMNAYNKIKLRQRYISYRRKSEAVGKNKIRRKKEEDLILKAPNELEKFRAENPLDLEEFMNYSGSNMSKYFRSNEEYESYLKDIAEGVDEEDIEDRYKLREDSPYTIKQMRLIDQFVRDFIIGFFPVNTQHIYIDPVTGVESIRWSRPVENSMNEIMEKCGLKNDLDGQRNVFRLVRLYSSLSSDRKGRVFVNAENPVNNEEWSMEEAEFVRICDWILKSIEQYGHPFVSPRYLDTNYTKLRSTEVFCSGIVPRVLAEAITGPDSQITFPNLSTYRQSGMVGEKVTADNIIDMARQEWYHRTFEDLDREVRPKNVRQRKVIYDIQRALAEIDNLTDFTERTGIENTVHHHLYEWEEYLKNYEAATKGTPNWGDVREINNEMFREYREMAAHSRGEHIMVGPPWNRHEVDQKYLAKPEAALNLAVHLIRANGVLRPEILISMIPEKAMATFMTQITLNFMGIKTKGDWVPSERTKSRMRSDEAANAMDAYKLLHELAGPGGCRLFSRSGMPCTHDNVINFVRENYMKPVAGDADSESRIRKLDEKITEFSNKLLVGDKCFRRTDTWNWFKALIYYNQRESLGQQAEKESYTDVRPGSLALTGEQIEDILEANEDIGFFFTEMMGTDGGVSAFNMLRGHNVASVNPLSYKVDQMLRDHGVTNAVITAFVDSFPKYGINFLYNITPLSRTMSYMYAWQKQANERDVTIGDLVIGGNLSSFKEGLMMNLMYDGFSFGRSLVLGAILAIVWTMLGYEPPERPQDLYNSSMWKIGGEEYNQTWWTNDVLMGAVPFAHFCAIMFSDNPDKSLAWGVALDSLHDQIDGNVVLDFAYTIKNFERDMAEWQQVMEDPDYDGPIRGMDFMPSLIYAESLSVINKMTPFNPLVQSLMGNHSWIIRSIVGEENVFEADPYKKYDDSADWKIERGVTKYVDDYNELQYRKIAKSNYLLAGLGDLTNLVFNPADKTGFFWYEMPIKTKTDPMNYFWASEFAMDYNNIPEEFENQAQYEAAMAEKVLQYIDSFENKEQAKRLGFFIPSKAGAATANYVKSMKNAYKAIYAINKKLGNHPSYEFYDLQIDKCNHYLYDWLWDNDFPSWGVTYGLLATDFEVSYIDDITGKPVPGSAASVINPNVHAEFFPKGNMPNDWLPFTKVERQSTSYITRGPNAETVNAWAEGGLTPEEHKRIRQMIGDFTIEHGQDAGKRLADVLYGGDGSGNYIHPNESTIGKRSYVHRDRAYRNLEDVDDDLALITGLATDASSSTASLPNEDSITQMTPEDLMKLLTDMGAADSYNDIAPVLASLGALNDGSGQPDQNDNGNGNSNGNDNGSNIAGIGEGLVDPSIFADALLDPDSYNAMNNVHSADVLKYKNDESAADGSIFGDLGKYNEIIQDYLDGKTSTLDLFKDGTNLPSNGGGSWNYSSSYSGGGSGGNRTPYIYSNPRTLNSDRPSTSGAPRPYDANKTYLNPSFETKGSRESYRRQDI